MPERTADVRRVVELVGRLHLDRPRVAVVGHPCPWRGELAEVLAEQLPQATVTVHDVVPDSREADLSVGLDLDGQEAGFRVALEEWETSGRRARGEPLVPGARWTPAAPRSPRPSPEPAPVCDVMFVPVSGVRAPRRIRFSWCDPSDIVLWDDDNAHLGDLEELLGLSAALRVDLGDADAGPDDVLRRLRAEVGPDFVVVEE